MAKVSRAWRAHAPSTPTITSALVSSTVVRAASQDWLVCWDRKYASKGYERCVSSTSAAQRSQSRNNCSRAAAPPGPACRRSSSAALGGEPARASRSEMLTSRRENAW